MQTAVHGLLLVLALSVAAVAHGAANPAGIEVLVTKDGSAAVAFNGRTDARGSFATSELEAGSYIVQFNSKASALKGKQYSIAAVGGKRAVTAAGVAGDKFAGGGVAMRVEVAAGARLTGQVAAGNVAAVENVKAAQAGARTKKKAGGTDSLRRSQDLSGQGATQGRGAGEQYSGPATGC